MKKSKFFFTMFVMLNISLQTFAQSVGISSAVIVPDVSTMLEVRATNKGILIPQVPLTGVNDAITIASPATSLLVYCTGTGGLSPAGYYYNSGTPASPNWIRFLTNNNGDAWLLLGNAGTNPSTSAIGVAVNNNFIGTTDAKDWVVATNNLERIRVSSVGNIGVGTITPTQLVDVEAGYNKTILFNSDQTVSNRTVALLSVTQNAPAGAAHATFPLVDIKNSDWGGTAATMRVVGYNPGPIIELNTIDGTSKQIQFDGFPSSGSYIYAGGTLGGGNPVTGNYIDIKPIINANTWSLTHTGHFVNIARADIINAAGQTLTYNGDLVNFESNLTQTAGTGIDNSTILTLNQKYVPATGSVFKILNSGAGNISTLSTTNANANGVSIQIQSAANTQYVLKATSNAGATSGLYVRADGNVGVGTTAPDASAKLDVTSTISGLLVPRMTTVQRNAIVAPAEALLIYNLTTKCFEFWENGIWQTLMCACTPPVAPVATAATAITTTSFSANWNASAGATGYYLDVATDAGFTVFVAGFNSLNVNNVLTYNVTGLTCNTTYYYRVRAYNACGTSPNSNTITITTAACAGCPATLTINHTIGVVAPETKTVTYGVVQTNLSGANKCWITQNLGADHFATSATADLTNASAGWYWQFNRKQGYLPNPVVVIPGGFLGAISENSDWIAANDPCTIELGALWRIPTNTEWTNVDANGVWNSVTDGYASVLKIHLGGNINAGSLTQRGSNGVFWTSTGQTLTGAFTLYITAGASYTTGGMGKIYGYSLRCLRD